MGVWTAGVQVGSEWPLSKVRWEGERRGKKAGVTGDGEEREIARETEEMEET